MIQDTASFTDGVLIEPTDLDHRNVDAPVAHFLVVQAPGGISGGDILLGDMEQHEPPVQDDAEDGALLLAKPLLTQVGQFTVRVIFRFLVYSMTRQTKDPKLSTIDHGGEMVVEVSGGQPLLGAGSECESGTVRKERGLESIPGQGVLNEGQVETEDMFPQGLVIVYTDRVQTGVQMVTLVGSTLEEFWGFIRVDIGILGRGPATQDFSTPQKDDRRLPTFNVFGLGGVFNTGSESFGMHVRHGPELAQRHRHRSSQATSSPVQTPVPGFIQELLHDLDDSPDGGFGFSFSGRFLRQSPELGFAVALEVPNKYTRLYPGRCIR